MAQEGTEYPTSGQPVPFSPSLFPLSILLLHLLPLPFPFSSSSYFSSFPFIPPSSSSLLPLSFLPLSFLLSPFLLIPSLLLSFLFTPFLCSSFLLFNLCCLYLLGKSYFVRSIAFEILLPLCGMRIPPFFVIQQKRQSFWDKTEFSGGMKVSGSTRRACFKIDGLMSEARPHRFQELALRASVPSHRIFQSC